MKIKIQKTGLIGVRENSENEIEYEIGLKDGVISQLSNTWVWNQDKKELLYESNLFSKNNNYLILQIGNIDETLIGKLRSLTDKVFKN